ncbi:IS66 family transposase [Alkalilimnicola ehrlichii]|uniref:IS66 family transposase n=1 Tax=Alkalilimnicola ehrlichii TaxID=351052 RepID=UPI0022B35FFC|nr:IS66 family transposase [Alkalilimnicola ehrlichii]
MYSKVLEQPLGEIGGTVRAKRRERLPVVLSRDEVSRLLANLSGAYWLIACLQYGSGLRLLESVRLRVKDVDFRHRAVFVRRGKGGKDRVVTLADELITPLQRQVAELEKKLAEKDALLATKEAHWAARECSMFEQIRLLLDSRFGPSTERYHVDQQQLQFDEAEQYADAPVTEPEAEAAQAGETAPSVPAKRRNRGGRVRLPAELPRVEVVHDIPEAQRYCPHDGSELTCIGEEVTEQLDVIPARVQVRRHIRRKYACRCCEEGVHTASMPPQPLPRSMASPGLLAYIATAKYEYGLPLYRQAKGFERKGIPLPRNTLARWMVGVGELLTPLGQALQDHLLAQPLIHMDETTVQVNTEPGRTASSTSYMWVQRGGPPGEQVVRYDYDTSRSGRVPQRLLGDYAGVLVTDGYEGYAQVVRENGITHAGCWAHARRKFVEAQKVQPKGKTGKADWALSLIGKLYRVEREGKTLDPEDRLVLRQQQSRPLIDKLQRWLEKSITQVPPKTAIGKALRYLQTQWPRLTRFLDDGRIPLDNNPAENAIRPFVVGRKNWLFSHTTQGAAASAMIYSVIETAKANGLEPYEYLEDVLTRLPAADTDQAIQALLPWNWGKTIQA